MPKLANMHTITKSMEIDVVIVSGSDDKAVGFGILNDLNCVDSGSMGDDEIPFNEEFVCFLLIKVNIFNIPHLELTGGVS